MKIYISGKIGEEVLTEATREKFAQAERMLRQLGYDVFNPTTSGLGDLADRCENFAHCMGKHTTWYAEILKLDIKELSFCASPKTSVLEFKHLQFTPAER